MQESRQKNREDFVLPSISSNPDQFVRCIEPNKLSLSRPNCIGEFSLDRTRRQQLGRSKVRYFYEGVLGRKMSTNLAQNINTFVAKEGDEGLDQIFRWIMSMATPGSSLRKVIHQCDFVLWRGTLTRLSISSYDVNSFGVGIKMACTKYNDVYFIREFDTTAKTQSESMRSDYQRRASYAGFKFEQIVTVDELGDKPDTSAPVDTHNEFVGVFKTTLSSVRKDGGSNSQSSLRLLYGAEIDCISPHGDYLEIKTQFKTLGHGKGFPNKAMKWWLQSYLIGIKHLIVGFHENLILNRVELLPVESLHKLAFTSSVDNGHQPSSSSVCFAFLLEFLQLVKRALESMPEGTILVAERQPTSHEFTFAVIQSDDLVGQREYCVISEEFKNHLWR